MTLPLEGRQNFTFLFILPSSSLLLNPRLIFFPMNQSRSGWCGGARNATKEPFLLPQPSPMTRARSPRPHRFRSQPARPPGGRKPRRGVVVTRFPKGPLPPSFLPLLVRLRALRSLLIRDSGREDSGAAIAKKQPRQPRALPSPPHRGDPRGLGLKLFPLPSPSAPTPAWGKEEEEAERQPLPQPSSFISLIPCCTLPRKSAE